MFHQLLSNFLLSFTLNSVLSHFGVHSECIAKFFQGFLTCRNKVMKSIEMNSYLQLLPNLDHKDKRQLGYNARPIIFIEPTLGQEIVSYLLKEPISQKQIQHTPS